MNEVTFHPVDTAWIGRLFRSRLEGPADTAAEKALYTLADQITNIKMAATALANELGPNEVANFAAGNRPFFIIDDDPNEVAAALEALMACDTLDEMMSIMATQLNSRRPSLLGSDCRFNRVDADLEDHINNSLALSNLEGRAPSHPHRNGHGGA